VGRGLKVQQVPLVLKVLKVLLGFKEVKVPKVPKGLKDQQVRFKGLKVILVLQVHHQIKDLKIML
jgi:hypothetical protein